MGYQGSKSLSGAYQAIIALMPQHQTYIETHLAGGTVQTRKPPANLIIGVDRCDQAIDAFKQSDNYHRYSGKLELNCCDVQDYLKSYPFTGQELVYADPPYLLSTRTSWHRYRYEYTEQQHFHILIGRIFKSRMRPILGN
ncbi:MAG: hypothetical protein GY814_10155 [Gammaproteobacteria bacterium]|nr:hypothetical protein [Gammaproteobacteria bacterium]